jgi:enoyl-CoA hydratase/carnithine racemase
MEATTLQVVVAGTRGTITLHRPDKLNPLSPTALSELAAAARWFDEEHPEVKVVIVSGSGRAFSAGADLSAFVEGDGSAAAARAGADLGRRMADGIEAMRAVTIASIHGHCIGGGLVLASACDLRVATETARFAIPEDDLGIPLTWGGIPRLVRDIGPAMTKELVMTCRPFDAAEAKAIGFVNRVVPDDRLEAEVDLLAEVLQTKSALTLTATKQHVDAITSAMVGMARTWNDADSLVVAQRDPESRDVAAAYIERLGKPRS